MTAITLKPVHCADAGRMIADGAVLIDIREMDEHANERIPGARHMPLSRILKGAPIPAEPGEAVIFFCRSGYRTIANDNALASAAGREAYVLEGGIEAWRDSGQATEKATRGPIEIARQVQITAGTIALLGVVLGTFINPWFYLLDLLVGSGLTFAGVTGTCPMALLIERMPWNERFRPRSGKISKAAA
jgi:rhodanese-related sulfurtransferase